MFDTDVFTDEIPLENPEREALWRRKLRQYREYLLQEKVERIDELVGMGELPAGYWSRRQGE